MHCHKCLQPVVKETPQAVCEYIMTNFLHTGILITFKMRIGEKSKRYFSHYINDLRKQGFTRCCIQGKIIKLTDPTVLKTGLSESQSLKS